MKKCRRCGEEFETADWRRFNCFICSPQGEAHEKYCKNCGVGIGTDGRKKFCDPCWKEHRRKQQKDWLHRTKVGKAEEDCKRPLDYCYMELIEAMIANCWEPECETCVLDGYCAKATWVSRKCLSTSVV